MMLFISASLNTEAVSDSTIKIKYIIIIIMQVYIANLDKT